MKISKALSKIHTNSFYHCCLIDPGCWQERREFGLPMGIYLKRPVKKHIIIIPWNSKMWADAVEVEVVTTREEREERRRRYWADLGPEGLAEMIERSRNNPEGA